MTKHQLGLEDLADKVKTATYVARFEAKGRKKVLLAADIAEAVQMSLNVFLGRAQALTALTLCFLRFLGGGPLSESVRSSGFKPLTRW